MPYFELVLLLLAIGATGGFLSGLLGVGGGIIFVPALFFALKSMGIGETHLMHIAIATSLAVILATGFVSAFYHHKRQAVDMAIVRSWGPYIVAGVIIGSFFASSVDGQLLRKIFATLTGLIAVYMAFPKGKLKAGHGHKVPAFVLHGCCVAIGMVSSLIGVGGAIMNIPMMTYTGVPIQRAVGTGAALGLTVALPGTIGYIISGLLHLKELPPLSLGYVNLLAAGAIIPLSILLAPLGVKVSHALPQIVLRRIFAGVLTLICFRMFMTL